MSTGDRPESVTNNAVGVLRGVAHLSVGTIVAQGLTVASQVVLAAWLGPEDFGLWATASASIAVLTGLINFGEVNSYLTDATGSIRSSRRAAWRMNSALVSGGFLVGIVYLQLGRSDVALLVVLAALNLPLLGDSNLLYAAFIKQRQNANLVRAQVLSALVRTFVGVAVAWLTGSAVAFGVSMLAYSVVMIAVLAFQVRSWPECRTGNAASCGPRGRLSRTVTALFQMLPTQIDYLVVSIAASPQLLGVYFLSYQVTVGLAGLVGVPLSRSVLAALAAVTADKRSALAGRLMSLVAGGVGVLTCVATAAALLAGTYLPTTWQEATPTVCLLLASLPARFVASLADSHLVADGRWWRSAAMNGVDMVGIGAVAIVATTGSLRWLASSMVTWAVVFTTVRLWTAWASLTLEWISAAIPSALTALLLTSGVLQSGPSVWIFIGFAAAVSVGAIAWQTGVVTIRRPIASRVA